MPPHPGEVWLADLGLAAKTRPVVVVSRDDPDPPRALLLYVPLTRQHRQSPYEVVLPHLPFLDRDSVANVQGLGSLPTVRLERRLGKLPGDVMVKIKRALTFQYLRQNRSTCKGFRRFIELLSTTTTTPNPQEALNGQFSTFAMPPPRCHEDHVAPMQPCRPGNARHDGACDNVGPVPVGGHGGELSDGATLFFRQ